MSKNFKFAFSKWLEWLQNEKRISINTFDAYERDLTKWSEFTSNSNNPKKKDFRSYMGYLLEKKNSRASIARKISSIRNFYKFASQRNFLSCDDMKKGFLSRKCGTFNLAADGGGHLRYSLSKRSPLLRA